MICSISLVVSHSISAPAPSSDRKLSSKSFSFQRQTAPTDSSSPDTNSSSSSSSSSSNNNTISPDDDRKLLHYTLSSTALSSEAGYAGKKLTITVSSPELTLTTTVFSNWTVSETR